MKKLIQRWLGIPDNLEFNLNRIEFEAQNKPKYKPGDTCGKFIVTRCYPQINTMMIASHVFITGGFEYKYECFDLATNKTKEIQESFMPPKN